VLTLFLQSLILQEEEDEGLAELKTPLDIRGSTGFRVASPAMLSRGASPAPIRTKRNRTVICMLDLSAHMSIDRALGSSFVCVVVLPPFPSGSSF
jgi:hypothetical protein